MSKKLIFFGAGEVCRFSIGYANARHLEVAYISDNNSEKWGTRYRGIPIIPPDKLQEIIGEEYEIIITTGSKVLGEITKQLQSMGLSYGTDFITYYDKFFTGTMPVGISPGYQCEDDKFTLVKPISDCALFTDAEHKYVYRAIGGRKAKGLKYVFDKIQNSKTLCQYIQNTWISENKELKERFPLILQHDYLPFISYSSEWPPLMFRDYVLFLVGFMSELDKAGLGLQDSSPYNAGFLNGRFTYVDFGGLYWDKTNWFIMRNFIELHINILVMMSKCQAKGYLYLKNPKMIAKFEDISGYLDEKEKTEYLNMIQNCEKYTLDGDVQSTCRLLKSYIMSITSDYISLTDWAGYQSNLFKESENEENFSCKQKEVINLVRNTKAKTMLDLAGNMGWYSIALSKELDYAVTVDIDAGISDSAYENIKKAGCKNIHPICLNFIEPTPAVYRNLIICTDVICPHMKGAVERLRCDMVLALAVIHHLALTQGLNFDEIIGQIYLFTNRYLIIEFIEREDEYVKQYLRQYDAQSTAWYTKENFEKALADKFDVITVRPSETPTRKLYLCKRKL